MPRLLDPTSTVAIILGAHDWTRAGLPRAPSFRRSAAHFQTYLLTQPPYGLGFEPDLVLNLFDDPSPAGAQLVRIRDTVRSFIREGREAEHPIRDVLIYYVGHGSCEHGARLHFLIRDSSEGIEEQSSIAASDLAQVLRVAAPQQRRLLVLDCCFSEAATEAFGAMGALDEAVAATALRDLEPGVPPPERGTLLLCSSPRQRVSIGLPNAERTLFTGELLTVLREGSPSRRAEMLSFGDLRDDIYERMLRDYDGIPPRPALHQPDQQAGDLTRLPAFPNAAWTRIRAEEERQEAEARRRAEEERQEAEARHRAEEERQEAEAAHEADEERRTNKRRQKQEQPLALQTHAAKTEPPWKRYRISILSAGTTLSVLVLVGAWILFKPASAPPIVATGSSLTVAGNSAAAAMGILAPSDPNYRPAQLRITATDLPLNGKVVLADGTTAITTGETLTVDQLTGLRFAPAPGVFHQSSTFAYSVENPDGLTTVGKATLTIGPNTMRPTVLTGSPLIVAGNSSATAMGILAPSDPNYPPAQLRITAADLPSNGKVVLADGTTAINKGETFTVDQLTGLRFVPAPGVFDKSATFAYSVENPAGLTTVGRAILTIGPNRASNETLGTAPAVASNPEPAASPAKIAPVKILFSGRTSVATGLLERPDNSAKRLAALQSGTRVKVTKEEIGGWYKVIAEGSSMEGFVKADAVVRDFYRRAPLAPVKGLSERCAKIIERSQLGEAISDADRAVLKSNCR